MSGKVVVAFVAAAVSSASAATVGVVYTRVVHTGNFDHVTSVADVSSGPTTAVVLNAKEGYFDSVKDSSSSDADAPVCPGGEGSPHCVVVARAAEVRLNILGYTLTLPSIWLGGDSEDSYTANGEGQWTFSDLPSGLEVVVHAAGRRHRHAKSGIEGASGAQTPDGSKTDNKTSEADDDSQNASSAGGQNGGQLIVFEVVMPSSVFPLDFRPRYSNPLAAFFAAAQKSGSPTRSPPDGWYTYSTLQASFNTDVVSQQTSTDTYGGSGSQWTGAWNDTGQSAVPEASTWMMTIAGFTAVGFYKRRRVAAAFRFNRG